MASNTLILKLRHLDRFYIYCDSKYGKNALDDAFGEKNVERLHRIFDEFYVSITSKDPLNSADVQCWDVVSGFFHYFAKHWAVSSEQWRALQRAIPQPGTIRDPNKGLVKFTRSLPDATVEELLATAEPGGQANPFAKPEIQVRNWLLVLLMLLCGLRRGEVLLLTLDSLKQDLDVRSGALKYWLDVTETEEDESYVDTRATLPSIKTEASHRQVPISEELAHLIERYISEYRIDSPKHQFLITSQTSDPLSAESVAKILKIFSLAMKPEAMKLFRHRTGKKFITPHDLRHTCACVRYVMFSSGGDKERALERMRAFFGWSKESNMPERYARAAIVDDVKNSVNKTFDEMLGFYRKNR